MRLAALLPTIIRKGPVCRAIAFLWRFSEASSSAFSPILWLGHFGGGLDASNHPIDPQKGFLYTFIIFGILSMVCFYLSFHFTKERIKPVSKEKSSIKDDLKDLMKNKPWIILFIASTLNLVYVGVFGTAMKYYFDYYVIPKTVSIFGWNVWGLDVMSVFNGYGSIVIMIVLLLPVSKWLASKFGKRNTLIACYSLVAVSIIGWYFCKPEQVGLLTCPRGI